MITDKYRDFSELSRHEIEGKDYKIECRDRGSQILILAIHGGKIERGTAEIAYRIAGQEYSFYTFLGIKTRGNKDLHIASLKFDEPRCRAAVAAAEIAVSIHGHNDDQNEFVMIGGLHGEIVPVLQTELENAGYAINPVRELRPLTGMLDGGIKPPFASFGNNHRLKSVVISNGIKSPESGWGGTSLENICNRCGGKKGVQFEISRKLRERFETQPAFAKVFADKVCTVLSRF